MLSYDSPGAVGRERGGQGDVWSGRDGGGQGDVWSMSIENENRKTFTTPSASVMSYLVHREELKPPSDIVSYVSLIGTQLHLVPAKWLRRSYLLWPVLHTHLL